MLEQRPKGPAEFQSPAPPVKAKPKTVEQALIPQYHFPENARYLTWDNRADSRATARPVVLWAHWEYTLSCQPTKSIACVLIGIR